jgi:hypothetical protein
MKQILSRLLAIAALFSFSLAASAFAENLNPELTPEAKAMGFRNSTELQQYFEISEFTVTENEDAISTYDLAMTGFQISNGTASSIGDILTNFSSHIGDVSKWIALGSKLWEVVKNNQPVVNVTTQTVSVLPESLPDWRKMETWKGPQAKSYTLAAKNLYGATVISHTYTVAFHYGGSLNGHGQFLANATIIPTHVDVSWGFTLNSSVKVGEPLNTGTTLDPVPGIDLGLEWSMSSMLKKTQGVDQFFVRGDGPTSHVNLY